MFSIYIVMELVTGGNAQEFMRNRGPFHWMEATSVLIDVCRGMGEAHKAGLIHRDIKPTNILRSNGPLTIAHVVNGKTFTMTGTGTVTAK